MDRVRIGIVGTGNIAPMNARGYLDHPQCDVVAVCDPRRDKAERMAKVLQLCFAVYQASIDRGPVDPTSIDTQVSPPWWPPSPELLMQEAMEMGAARQ